MDGTDRIVHPFTQSSAQLLHVLQKMGHQERPGIRHSRLDDMLETLNRHMQVYRMRIITVALTELHYLLSKCMLLIFREQLICAYTAQVSHFLNY